MSAAARGTFPDEYQQGISFAHGVAIALTWSDHRCGCGAGYWTPVDDAWIACRVCGDLLAVSEIVDDVVEDRVPPRNLTQ